MKRILLIIALVFASAVMFGQKFGHINTAELVQLCPEADQAREALAAISKEFQDTYQDMANELNKKYEAYQQKASTWTASIKESKEKELTELQQRIQEFYANAQQDMQVAQQEKFQPVYEKASKVIESLAKKHGLIYVFEAGSLLYIDPAQSIDLTNEGRKEMGVKEGRTLEALQEEIAAQQAAE